MKTRLLILLFVLLSGCITHSSEGIAPSPFAAEEAFVPPAGGFHIHVRSQKRGMKDFRYLIKELPFQGVATWPAPPETIQKSKAICVPIQEVQHTWVCVFNSYWAMNVAFNRMGAWIEENKKMYRDNDLLTSRLMRVIAGHDYQGHRMLEYRKEFERRRQELSEYQNPDWKIHWEYEEAFWKQALEPLLAREPHAVVLGVVAESRSLENTLSHELLHAQYFTSDVFRNAVDTFWKDKVQAEDKAKYYDCLRSVYDVNDDYLMRNEFQAYILQPSPSGCLHDLRGKYRENLKETLLKIGEIPIQFSLN